MAPLADRVIAVGFWINAVLMVMKLLAGHFGHATRAAGAVVTKDVPDYAVMAGVPARQMGWMCECGGELNFKQGKKAVCPDCGRKYVNSGKKIGPQK